MNQLFLPPKLQILIECFDPSMVLIEKLCKKMWQPPKAIEIFRGVQDQSLLCYSTPNGLILLEILDWPEIRELRIYGMVGRGILRQGEAVVSDLRAIAAYKGCGIIGGEGVPKGWLRAAPKLGFKPVSTHFVMEL